MPPLSQGPLPTNEVSVAEADLAHPPARVAKAPRGKHGAAIALGALALASGVTAGIDAAGSPTDINVGRLAITLTAHGGFKLDTCTNNNSDYTGGGGSGFDNSDNGFGTGNYQTSSITESTFNDNPLSEMVGVDTVPILGFNADYLNSFFSGTDTPTNTNQEYYLNNDGLAQVEMNGEIFNVKVESNGAVTLIDGENVNNTDTPPQSNQEYTIKNDGLAQVEMNGEIFNVKVAPNGEVTLIDEDN